MLEGNGIKGKNGANQPAVSGQIEQVVMLQYLDTIKANAMCEAAMDFLKMIGIALCIVVPFIIFAT